MTPLLYALVTFSVTAFVRIAAIDERQWEGLERKLCPASEVILQPPNRKNTSEHLSRLRSEMKKATSVGSPYTLDGYVVTSYDSHQSPQLSDRDKRIKFISGYSGKNAVALITMDRAVIWVDPLDTVAANDELSCDWIIFTNAKSDVSPSEWIQRNLRLRSRIGIDPTLVSYAQWDALNRRDVLIPVKTNLVDIIWNDKPSYSHQPYEVLNHEFSGKTWQNKLTEVREVMKNESCDALVVTALDEIAWLLNVRGQDIPYLPVIRAYAFITDNQFHLYTDPTKLSMGVNASLKTENCFNPLCARVHSYESVWGDLKTLTQVWRKIWLPGEAPLIGGVSRAIYSIVPAEKRFVKVSPVANLKAVKNDAEIEGMINAHIRDAAAFCDFMAYFEYKMKEGEEWDELKFALGIDQFRREQLHNRGISFKTSVGFGSHSAQPYYDLKNATSRKINGSSILLVDSGGQYLDGTTDVTRVFHYGAPTEEQIEAYTLILQGLIDFASLSFPESFIMSKSDAFARAPLWRSGLDYRHATSHSVGSFLSVEEGPIVIDQEHHSRSRFKEGFFVTDEPAFYKSEKWGIRLSNVLQVVHTKNGSDQQFLGFRPVTLVPFEPKLIDLKRLSPYQVRWLNSYYSQIREKVGAALKQQLRMKGFYWMMEKSQGIPERYVSRGSSVRPFTDLSLRIVAFIAVSLFLNN